MSTERATFPWRRPVEQPPPLLGVIENGRPTPSYVLAWVCDSTTFFKNLGGGELGKVDYCNFSDVVSNNWRTRPKFGFGLHPIPYPGTDGNFYLIVMFNDSEANHIARVRNLTEDPLIASARVAMGVDQDKSLEKTLQWLRWPLNWLQAEERLRRMALLPQQPEESDSDSSEGKGSDEPELEDS
ncbi:hypothetical protein B0H15DRAFT_831635, partial [Mycena belliarum]